MEEEQTKQTSHVKANRLCRIDESGVREKDHAPYVLEFIDDNAQLRKLPLTRETAQRIRGVNAFRNYQDRFNLYLDGKGVVEDYDTEPKDSNIPFDTEETVSEPERILILEKTRAGTVNVKRGVGINAEIKQRIVRAAREVLENGGEIRAHDFLDNRYFVRETRNEGRLIHVEPVS